MEVTHDRYLCAGVDLKEATIKVSADRLVINIIITIITIIVIFTITICNRNGGHTWLLPVCRCEAEGGND